MLPFSEKDSEFFFGRDRFLFGEGEFGPGLIEMVQTQPLVSIIGPSGSGKSSVVSAGLIPKLRAEGTWIIETLRPQNQPLDRLTAILVKLLEPGLDKIQQLDREATLATNIREKTRTLSQIVSKILESHSGKRLLIVIDQFEEIYTCSKEIQDQFIELFLDAVSTNNGLTILLTLRADFYAQVFSHERFADVLRRLTPQLLSSMNQEELQASIEKPLEKSGMSLEAELTQRILDDLGREPGNLPLLEFTLFELWKKKRNGKLTHGAYNEIGGVKKAIANHAEKVYNQLNSIQKEKAQYIFTQLVYPGRGTEGIRRVATRSEVGDENWSLVNDLANYKGHSTDYSARLLVIGRDETNSEDTVEIVHEALIREWKVLQEWVSDAVEFRTWQESLRFSMQTWEDSRQDQSALLRGKILIESEKWLKLQYANIRPSEKAFIQKSRKSASLKQYGIAALVFIFTTLSVFAQRQFADRQFEKQFAKVLIERSASPDQVFVLQEANRRAQQQIDGGNADAAIELYKKVLKATKAFEETSKAKNGALQKSDLEKISKSRKSAETSLANIIKDKFIPELKKRLSKRPPNIGKITKGPDLVDYENRFTGALKTTYEILMRKPGLGADEQPDGKLDIDEIIYLPCDTLELIDKLWRDATNGKCGFYGERDFYSSSDCKELSESTLSFDIFESEYVYVIELRIRSCPGFHKVPP